MADSPTSAAPAAGTQTATPTKSITDIKPATADEANLRSFRDVNAASDEEIAALKDDGKPIPGDTKDEDDEDDDDDLVDDEEDDDEEEVETEGDDEAEADEGSEEDEGEEDDEEGEFDSQDIAKKFGKDGRAEFKIDGKVKRLSWDQINSIVSSGASNIAYRQRVEQHLQEESSKMRKAASGLKSVNEKLTPAWKAFKSGDLRSTLLELADAAGQSRLETHRKLREQFVPIVSEWLGLDQRSVEERLRDPRLASHHEYLKTKEENDFLRTDAERRAARDKQPQQKVAPGVQQMQALQSRHGISDGEVEAALQDLRRYGKVNGQEKDFPVNLVVEQIGNTRAVNAAFTAINVLKGAKKLQEDDKFVDKVVGFARKHPDAGHDRLVRYSRKLARQQKEAAVKGEETRLQRELGRKALRGKDKSKLKAPTKAEQGSSGRPLRFSDLNSDDDLP